jgi:AcrR family transcriptional regulator
MTPTRRDEHVADTRQALVDAARTLFTEQGYAATGTEEIVAAARVTRGALYHHFHDKSDLFRAVMEQIAREVAEHLIDAELSRPAAPSQPPADAWDEVRDGLRAFLGTTRRARPRSPGRCRWGRPCRWSPCAR